MRLSLQFDASPEREENFFRELPAAPAVYQLRGQAGDEPYIGKTGNLRRRMQRLLSAPQGLSRKLNLRGWARQLDFELTASDFEAGLRLYRLLREAFPTSYARRLHLRPAPLLRLSLDNPFPRLSVTTRIASLKGAARYYGPFPTRSAADDFSNDSLDLFFLRRCTEELAPRADHPGCPYLEMKMCLAPCNLSSTAESYASEAARVADFLQESGLTTRLNLERERDAASAELEFERAAAAHQKLGKLQTVMQKLPELVRPIDRLNGVILQRSAQPDEILLFKFVRGMLAEPVALPLIAPQQVGSVKTPQSMEARISLALDAVAPPEPSSAAELMEHLAILKRWFYRGSRVGEIFLADRKGELPMRRVVRGASRVFKGEAPQPDLSDRADVKDYWQFRGKEAGL